MAPPIFTTATRLLARSTIPHLRRGNGASDTNGDSKTDFGQGSSDFGNFNNNAILILFGLIAGGMVLATLWFFFWAKNGGFHWGKNDWDDYKSTVLRRKGPDGRTLSNATKSTKLGGGSVVHDQSDYTSSLGYTDSSYTESSKAERGEMREKSGGGGWFRGGGAGAEYTRAAQKEPREKRRSSKHPDHDPERERRRRERREARRARDPELSSYRHERAARVGGMNREADGSHWDYTNTDRSELSSVAPLTKPSAAAKSSGKSKDKKTKEKEKEKREKKEKKETARREKQAAKDAADLAKRAAKAEKSHNAAVAKEKKKAEKRSSKHGADAVTETSTSYDDRTVYTGTYTDATPYSDDFTSAHSQSTGQNSSYYNAYRPNATIHTVREEDEASVPGTRVYQHHTHHHVPGLSDREVGIEDSISQVGRVYQPNQRKKGYDRMAGFRRGQGRRGSLSDSE
jgi:hypothetical protein